ncbi:MAG: hypothetical protein J5950_01655 [Clostridia bacterium]|nr:hypothetical protein [Clostridia bacterium]
MEKSLFFKCLDDTDLKTLMNDCLGEDAANQTAAQMYLEFEESAAASRRGDAEFSARLGELRLMISCVSDPERNAFFTDVSRKLYELGRTLRTYSRQSGSQEKTLALLNIAKELLDACDTVSAGQIDRGPGMLATELRALTDFPQRYSKELSEIETTLSYIRRELAALPLIKLRFTLTKGEIRDCRLELTGKIPVRKEGTHSGVAELPPALSDELKALRPELFSSINTFCEKQETTLLTLSSAISAFGPHLDYLLNLAKIFSVLKKNNIPLCNPRPSRRTTDLINLCDISLLLLRRNNLGRTMVMNNLTIHRKDAMSLMAGPIGSGKTSFLKAIAIAHVFFMLGLGVPAAMGSMMPVSGIYLCSHGYDPELLPPDNELRDSLLLVLWPDSEESSIKELNDCVAKLEEFSAKGAHGICAVRTFNNTRGGSGTISNIIPENVPLLDAIAGRDGKRTFRFKTVHRGDDSRATDIITRYGLDKSDLLLRFRTNRKF